MVYCKSDTVPVRDALSVFIKTHLLEYFYFVSLPEYNFQCITIEKKQEVAYIHDKKKIFQLKVIYGENF